MKIKYRWMVVAIIFLLLVGGSLGYSQLRSKRASSVDTKSNDMVKTQFTNSYLLEGYPIEAVPLVSLKSISASKYFVNDYPVNYFNVIFETEATQEDFLDYYLNLMQDVDEARRSNDMVEGKIGKYLVEASHYGDNPKNYGYLKVYLPESEYKKENRYYQTYPKQLVELEELGMEQESSYGLLNQKGGEVEYTQYFLLPTEKEAQENLIALYREKYEGEEGYKYDSNTGMMTWKKEGHQITMTFSKDHGRVYLMMRRAVEESRGI